MRKLLAALLLLPCTLSLSAQAPAVAPPAGSNWQRVQSLPAGTEIYVNGHAHARCLFKSASADSLTCTKSTGGKELTFPLTGITTIKISHRTRSTLTGLGAGGVTGGLLLAFAKHHDDQLGQSIIIGGIGCVAILAGPIIGFFTDFTRSTIYTAHP